MNQPDTSIGLFPKSMRFFQISIWERADIKHLEIRDTSKKIKKEASATLHGSILTSFEGFKQALWNL